MFCKNCGNQLGPQSLFCTVCGTKAPVIPQAAAQPAFTAPQQPAVPAQPAFTAPPQPEIPAQPAFTPPPAVPAQPAFTPPQPEIPAQPAFTPPQPAIPAQPAFTPQQPEIPAQPAFTPQQPAFNQPPVYVSPAVSSAPPQSGLLKVKALMYFITLIMLIVLTVGLFCGKMVTVEYERRTESYSAWSVPHSLYKSAYRSHEHREDGGFIFLKASKDVFNYYKDGLTEISHMSDPANFIADVIAVSLSLLAGLMILILVIISIVSFAKKKESRAWLMLFLSWVFALIAKLGALARVITVKVTLDSDDRDYVKVHIFLIISLILMVGFMVLSVIYKNRTKQQKTAAPAFGYPAGGQFPMQ